MNIPVKQLLCLLICLISFLSCSKNEDEKKSVEENYDLIVNVEYSKKSKWYPADGAKIYLYIGSDNMDFFGLAYDGEGIYSSGNKILKPSKTYIADMDGVAIINFENFLNVEISMVVESQYSKLKGFFYWEKYNFLEKATFRLN